MSFLLSATCPDAFALSELEADVQLTSQEQSHAILANGKEQNAAGSFAFGRDSAHFGRFFLWRLFGRRLKLEERSVRGDGAAAGVGFRTAEPMVADGTLLTSVAGDGRLLLCVVLPSAFVRVLIALPRATPTGAALLDGLDESAVATSVFGLACAGQPFVSAATGVLGGDVLSAVFLCDGTVALLRTSALGGADCAQQSLRPSSLVRRVFGGVFASTAPSSDRVVCACLHAADDAPLLFALSADLKLRVWDLTSRTVLITTELVDALSVECTDADLSRLDADSTSIRKLVHRDMLYLCVYVNLDVMANFVILCPTPDMRSVARVISFAAPAHSALVDFALQPTRLLVAYKVADCQFVVEHMQFDFDLVERGPWRRADVDDAPSPPAWLDAPPPADAAAVNARVDALFGAFSRAALLRAANVCCDQSTEMTGDLRRRFVAFAGRQDDSAKLWRHLWSACVQFHMDANQPLALLHLPSLQMAGLIRAEQFNLLLPVDSAVADLRLVDAGWRSCASDEQLSERALRHAAAAFAPHFDELRRLVVDGGGRLRAFIEDRFDELSVPKRGELKDALHRVSHCVENFAAAVILTLEPADSAEIAQRGGAPESRFGRLFAAFAADALSKCVDARFRLCRDAMLVVSLFAHGEASVEQSWQERAATQLRRLARGYARLAAPARMLCGAQPKTADAAPRSVVELFVLDAACLPTLDDWLLAPSCEAALLGVVGRLWPDSPSLRLPLFLLRAQQFANLQEYCAQLQPWPTDLKCSLAFCHGFALAHLCDEQLACEMLSTALAGAAEGDETLLALPPVTELSESTGLGPLSAAILLAVELFEDLSRPHSVVKMAQFCLSSLGESLELSAKLWTVMFKYQLQLGNFRDAFDAAQSNPDLNSRGNCLRQFVIDLLNRNEIGTLVDLPYGSLNVDVEEILEARCRGADVTKADGGFYSDVLLAFYLARNNYRRAAACSYELATRLRNEGGLGAVERAARALTVCLHCLALVGAKFAWLAVPRAAAAADNAARSPKRDADGAPVDAPSRQLLGIVDVEDVRRELTAANARAALLARGDGRDGRHRADAAAVVSAAPAQLLRLLLAADRFDEAARLSAAFSLPFAPVVDALAWRAAVSPNGRWLTHNCALVVEPGSANDGFALLRAYLDHFGKARGDATLHAAAVRRLLSDDAAVPAWLAEDLIKLDVAEYLRLLVGYGHLAAAFAVAIDHVDSLLESRESADALWLPYSVFDWMFELSPTYDGAEVQTKCKELVAKLDVYLRSVDESAAVTVR